MRKTRYVAAAAAVLLTAQAAPAFAFVQLSPDVHGLFVLLHVFGAILFVGNIIVSAMWMTQAKRSRDASVLHYASRSVVRADWLFTLPGLILLLGPGLITTGPHGGFPGASWAELALALLILSGIIWGALLVPLQRRMVALTREAVELKLALADHFYKVLTRWSIWGGVATLLPLVSLYLMVYKPQLWGGTE